MIEYFYMWLSGVIILLSIEPITFIIKSIYTYLGIA